MPTVHREGKLRFVVWSNDHSPPHVHAFTPEGEAVIELGCGGLLRSVSGMRTRDVMAAVRIVLREEARLMLKWREIHG